MTPPLISGTTANKIILALIAGAVTALSGWLVTATLEVKRNDTLIIDEVAWIKEWLREQETDMTMLNARVDRSLEMLARSMLIHEYRKQQPGQTTEADIDQPDNEASK